MSYKCYPSLEPFGIRRRSSMNPVFYNELDRNKFIRVGIIKRNFELDKNKKIETGNYSRPRPGLGRKKCKRVSCPYWLRGAICWNC